MFDGTLTERRRLDGRKFRDPDVTASGEKRAVVAMTRLKTLWFNTGSLCNIACDNCYMDSSPTNDRLAYLSAAEVRRYLNEISDFGLPVEEIGYTGGEPFMNRDLPDMVEESLARGYRVLVLTNAMRPMLNKRHALLALREGYGRKLTVRVSIDHFTRERHEAIRGVGSWRPMIEGLKWLGDNGFSVTVAGRTCWQETEAEPRRGYAALFAEQGIPVDACNPARLVLFPDMDAEADVPEITHRCWDILGVAPETMMCATSRMVIKRKGAETPAIVPCTLLPHDPQFELGSRLADSARTVALNHPHCARFCVLGGASCSPA